MTTTGWWPRLRKSASPPAGRPGDDPSTDFTAPDLAVLRSTWDYTSRREEFLTWCASVPRLANPAPVVRWNTDKSYLLDLAKAGVPVVPTRLLPPGSPLLAELPGEADGFAHADTGAPLRFASAVRALLASSGQ